MSPKSDTNQNKKKGLGFLAFRGLEFLGFRSLGFWGFRVFKFRV